MSKILKFHLFVYGRKRVDKYLTKQIGARLKKIRNERGRSIEYVSSDTDLNVFRIEKGESNITITTLGILCSYYEISLKDFFDGIEPGQIE